jgi:hypothetical protein
MSTRAITPQNQSSALPSLITAGITILGAAAGAKLADDLVGGRGLPSFLAQLGGAILGGIGGKAASEALRSDSE